MYLRMPMPHRPRHPLLRVLSFVLGLAALGVLAVFGLMVAGVLLVGGAVFMLWRHWKLARTSAAARPAQPRSTDVLEGEFVVIRERHSAAH